LGTLFDVKPIAYLKLLIELNVRTIKSPGGLKDVGLRTFVTDNISEVLTGIDELAVRVIFIVLVFKREHVKLLSTHGEDIEHVELELGIIVVGN
jgi:hypothetical protein